MINDDLKKALDHLAEAHAILAGQTDPFYAHINKKISEARSQLSLCVWQELNS